MTNKEFMQCFMLVANVVILVFAFALKSQEAFFVLTSILLAIDTLFYKKISTNN